MSERSVNHDAMNILWMSHLIPYPPKSGVHLRSFNLLREVGLTNRVHLLAFIQEQWLKVFYRSRADGIAECRERLGEFCDSVTFLPIDRLERPGGRVLTALQGLLPGRSYTTGWLASAQAERAVSEIAERECFDLVHFDTLSLAPFARHFPNTARTLGHHNIESHMLSRRAENLSNPVKRAYFSQEARRVEGYEKMVAPAFDVNITCSDLDSRRLRAITPQARTVEIPNGVDVDYFRARGAGAGEAARVVFVGSLNWYPNVDAVEFLLRDIWPALQKLSSSATLDVVGSAPPGRILRLAEGLQGVEIRGFVDDVRPYMERAAVYICPIRDGGGTKLKLLDAFAMGRCVVAHPIACEGLDVTPGVNVILAETPQEFVRETYRALGDVDLRRRIGRAARELVVEKYSFAAIGKELCALFSQTAARRSSA